MGDKAVFDVSKLEGVKEINTVLIKLIRWLVKIFMDGVPTSSRTAIKKNYSPAGSGGHSHNGDFILIWKTG